jgi:uncharacterized membrane protein YbaN (DUF454 family)
VLKNNFYYFLGLLLGIMGFIEVLTSVDNTAYLLLISCICFHQGYINKLNDKYSKLYDKMLKHQKFNLETFDKIIKHL